MNKFHVVTGVPRSGSTLLCNILNQNPAFHSSSTSPLPGLIGSIVQVVSTSDEIKAALANDAEGTTVRLQRMVESVISNWYGNVEADVIFDKSRGWSFNSLLLDVLYPDTKLIACVRDLRNVFGSVEKQHRKTAIFDQAMSPNQKTIFNRADVMLGPEGLIGQCVVGLEDLMARQPQSTFVLTFEAFTRDPKMKIQELYEFIEEPYFEHDFEAVENTSKEVDALFLNKFPHVGSGKVTATDRNEWKKYLTPDLAGKIHNRYPQYNQAFGYQ